MNLLFSYSLHKLKVRMAFVKCSQWVTLRLCQSSASCLQCLGHFLLCHYCAIDKGFYPQLLRRGVQFTKMLMPHGSEFTQEACGRAEASGKITQDPKKPLHMKGPWHNQSCMAMELLPERKELWEDCRACHSLFCGRGNWGVAACYGYAGSPSKA